MAKMGHRLPLFVAGALLGAILGAWMVTRARQDDLGQQSEARELLRDSQLQDSVAEAVTGIIRYYGQQRGPIQHRLVESEQTRPLGPLRFHRVLMLQGQMPEQRLRIEEILRVPDSAQGKAPEELSAGEKATTQVEAWAVVSPSHLAITLAEGHDRASAQPVLEQWGWRWQRSLDNGALLVALPESALTTVDQALRRMAEAALADGFPIAQAERHYLAASTIPFPPPVTPDD